LLSNKNSVQQGCCDRIDSRNLSIKGWWWAIWADYQCYCWSSN